MMKKLIVAFCCVSLLIIAPAYAGVVMNLVSKDAQGNIKDTVVFSAEGDLVRMDESNQGASILFLGDKMIFLGHKEKSYVVIDDAMMNELQAAMKQMEAQLAAMPPEQRAMVEQMMQGEMPGGPVAKPRLEAMGGDKWDEYACQRYAVYEASEKTLEICAAAFSKVAGGEEVMAAFSGMVTFMQRIVESMPASMASMVGENPLGYMEEINGFPVQYISFENGKMVEEMTLDSVSEEDLDPGLFAPPADYRQEQTGL